MLPCALLVLHLACSQPYAQCGGQRNANSPSFSTTCCGADVICVEKDEYYSQCLPRDDARAQAQRPAIAAHATAAIMEELE